MTTPAWRQIYDKVAPALALLCLLLAMGAGVGTYVNDRAIQTANENRIADNEANAKTSCENANESRKASRTLWNFVLDLALSGGEATPAEVAYFAQIRDWIATVYMPRDCDDLSRRYEIPPPPTIPANFN